MRWIRVGERWHRVDATRVVEVADDHGVMVHRREVRTLCGAGGETAETPTSVPPYGAAICDPCLALLRGEPWPPARIRVVG